MFNWTYFVKNNKKPAGSYCHRLTRTIVVKLVISKLVKINKLTFKCDSTHDIYTSQMLLLTAAVHKVLVLQLYRLTTTGWWTVSFTSTYGAT